MRVVPRSVVLAGVALSLLSGACEPRLTLGSACVFDSECSDRLLCAGGRCRAECREDRDCAGGGDTCVRFNGTGGVCTPPASVVPCALNSDCGPGARCEAGECHAECRADIDCEGLGTCTPAMVCAVAATTPPASDGGVLPGECTGGRARCPEAPGVCTDLATDPGNCGACANRCPYPEACRRFGCVCDPPNAICDGSCRALEVDFNHCGACGTACVTGETCTGGRCCPTGQDFCDGACRDLTSDDAHCGACGRACPAGERCAVSECRPPEDECAGAIDVALAGPVTTVAFDPTRWTGGPPACSEEPNGYFRFVLDEPSLVMAVVSGPVGPTLDPSVGILEGGCGAAAGCAPLACGATDRVTRALPAGEHVVVAFFDGATGTSALTLDIVPLGGAIPIGPIPSSGDLVGRLDAGSATAQCGASGSAHAYWRMNCAARPIAASACGGALDVVLSHETAGTVSCAGACAGGTSLPSTSAAPDSLDVIFVRARDATSTGDYRVVLTER